MTTVDTHFVIQIVIQEHGTVVLSTAFARPTFLNLQAVQCMQGIAQAHELTCVKVTILYS